MQGDDPPYLSVGTAVSAKYKGAFCEAKVSKVVRIVKCKVTYKMGLGTATVNDEQIKGTLRVGQLVQARHPEKKEFVDATITKIQDCSQYTVVFDDGDITTLRRTALCLKSGRHFNESETLDQLPLTHPEHFGNPVMGGRRGRRSRHFKEDSSDGEAEEENEPDLELYSADTGKVVSVEASDKKRNKDNWFPGLIVMPSAQPTVRINVKDEFLVRSFKDGRYYTVPKKEVSEFKREMQDRVESSTLAEAVDKAVKFLDNDELPIHWERSSLFNLQSQYSDSEDNYTDSSDDEPTEEKDHFVAQLYKFMDDSGTPLNKTPTIGSKDVDFYRLFRIVHKMGGYNRVTNQTKWKSVTSRLKFTQTQNTYNQVKQVYKKCLFSYESFYRTLGCTMLNPTRTTKKNRGRPLMRDKDRITPVQSPKPDSKEEEVKEEVKKEEEEKPKTKKADKKSDDDKKKKDLSENSESSSDATDQSEAPPSKEPIRGKRGDSKTKEKKVKPAAGEKVKALVEKFEEHAKKSDKDADSDKVQQTRSKSQPSKSKEKDKEKNIVPESKTRETKPPLKETQTKTPKPSTSKKAATGEEEKKRGRKRINPEEKNTTTNVESSSSSSEVTAPPVTIPNNQPTVNVGDKLKVYYGPTHESKVTYEAKVIEIDKDGSGKLLFLVHYTGWNTRYDEWITLTRIAENLSATTKAKRLKQGTSPGAKSANKPPAKRGRGMSITGRSTVVDAPRSTTPSSVTSSSSRTKSPATPASRSRVTRQGDGNRRTRRTSVQTDISMHSESESDVRSESDSDMARTRSSSSKAEEPEPKIYRRKLIKTKGDKRKDDDDTEKEDDNEKPKRARKLRKLADVKPLEDSDEETTSQPKGREFDLNQIRSELKGFGKTIKVPSSESTAEKEHASSDESISAADTKETIEPEVEDKKEKVVESSEDIYEFKEPEPFEFESRKIVDDKTKKRIPRLFDDIDKSPPKKKNIKSPAKDNKEFEGDKKRGRRTPAKKVEEVPEEVEEKLEKDERKMDDPFDKLVESPSFHSGTSAQTDKSPEKPECVKNATKVLNLDAPLSIFEIPETIEDNSEDRLELSDTEERQKEIIFTRTSPLFLHSNFGKATEHVMDIACDSLSNKAQKFDDDEDSIRATIQRVIAQSSTDEESSDNFLNDSKKFDVKVEAEPIKVNPVLVNRVESEDYRNKKDAVEEAPKEKVIPEPIIASVFQESKSTTSNEVCSIKLSPITKVEEVKEVNTIKVVSKITDTILQKFNLGNAKKEDQDQSIKLEEVKKEIKEEQEPIVLETKIIPQDYKVKPAEIKPKTVEVKSKVKIEAKPKVELKPKPVEVKKPEITEYKKRSSRKFVSKEFIEESDSDTDSDSGQRLVIARSDEDSQTSLSNDNKIDIKEPAPCSSTTIQESPVKEEERNFKFEEIVKSEVKSELEVKEDVEVKDEEPDSHLHSMLLCEETIPGSPVPAPPNEPKPNKTNKNPLEMPFASAPSGCSNKSLMLQQQEKIIDNKPIAPPQRIIPIDNREASTVLDNTPPTTPESTISNLSPRGDIGGLSPNTADNESCKSTEAENDYSNQKRSVNKINNYSEEDSLLNSEAHTSTKKVREDLPSPCKKRRRSCKGESDIPLKRGRKPNRSRHNSDSDDTSEHSMHASIIANMETRLARSPRPSKYNFFVELDPSLDSAARIAVLQQKLQDLRKTYADVKAELVQIERRRKKIRRREREALKAAKQEMACT